MEVSTVDAITSYYSNYSWSPCRVASCYGPGPSAHDTGHGPFTRVVPPMGHDHFRRAVPAHGTATWYTRGGGGGKAGKEVGEGLRENEWPARCRGHQSRAARSRRTTAADQFRLSSIVRETRAREAEREKELRLRGVGMI
jgi:hypothetical protein